MNRATRRLSNSHHKREARKGSWKDPLECQTAQYIDKVCLKGISTRYIDYFGANKVLSIQGFRFHDMYIMGFRFNTEEKDIPWEIKLYWKNQLGFEDDWAFEVSPPVDSLIDQANMYWLMIPKSRHEKIAKLNLKNYNLFPRRFDL